MCSVSVYPFEQSLEYANSGETVRLIAKSTDDETVSNVASLWVRAITTANVLHQTGRETMLYIKEVVVEPTTPILCVNCEYFR